MQGRTTTQRLTHLLGLLAIAGLPLPIAFAADEVCTTCGPEVCISGDFSHRKEDPSDLIDGADNNSFGYREDINGSNFTITIAALPASTYTILVGGAEFAATADGERVFDIKAGDTVLAKHLDLFARAGGARKVVTVSANVEHQEDAIGGPLSLTFVAIKGAAKFNTIEVKSVDGSPDVYIPASDLADAFTSGARLVPDIKDAPIWRDAAQPIKGRLDDLIRRMSLAEKVAQLQNAAPAISRLGLPAYNYWNEALHGVANNDIATVFPEPIGAAASWNPALFREEGRAIGIEGRAKHNEYARQHNGDSKWWAGLDFWTPNINIFRDPRWGRGQETYGEDPHLTSEIGIEFVRGMQGDDPDYILTMAWQNTTPCTVGRRKIGIASTR